VAAHVLGDLGGFVQGVEKTGAGESGIRGIVAGLGKADFGGTG
jgi:hypothetical protein